MGEHIHDCIVVGAGPAGSAAALQMARDGLDVVLLERGNRPGEKNVMSGVLLPGKLAALVPDFRERAPLQRHITAGYEQYYLSEDEVLRLPSLRLYNLSDDEPGVPYTVYRSEFDAWFAAEAVDAGAELFTATLVEDLIWERGQVVGVRTRRGDLRAHVVIGADGVNSIVAEKSGLREPLIPAEVALIIREVLGLPSDIIEERFALQPHQGVLSLFTGTVKGPRDKRGTYHSELYTNSDSLSLTTEVRLDVLESTGLPNHEVLATRERHPFIARLIRGSELREYQAHLIPWGGVPNLDCLYGDGVLLAGDAGKFTTSDGVGSWPAMASGAAAARAVVHACSKGDFSRAAMAAYLGFLEEEGLTDSQRDSRESWAYDQRNRKILAQRPAHLLRLARRYYVGWQIEQLGSSAETRLERWRYSLLGDLYFSLIDPLVPWYLRWPLRLAAAIDTWKWRRNQKHGRHATIRQYDSQDGAQ